MTQNPALIDAPALAEYLGVSTRQVLYLRSRGLLPPQIMLGPGTRPVWRRADIDEMLASLPPVVSPQPEPAQLRAGRERQTQESVAKRRVVSNTRRAADAQARPRADDAGDALKDEATR